MKKPWKRNERIKERRHVDDGSVGYGDPVDETRMPRDPTRTLL